mgnify:CR=1 FL=1
MKAEGLLYTLDRWGRQMLPGLVLLFFVLLTLAPLRAPYLSDALPLLPALQRRFVDAGVRLKVQPEKQDREVIDYAPQERAQLVQLGLRGEGSAADDRGVDLPGRRHLPRRDPVGVAQLQVVGAGELLGVVVAGIDDLLPLPDHPELLVVEDRDLRGICSNRHTVTQ